VKCIEVNATSWQAAINVGTTISVRSIENVTPKNTTAPIDCRDSAPAPVAMTSGMAPKAVHRLVISTGRNRIVDDSITASRNSLPRSRSWLANSTIRMPFFAASPISMIAPIWLKIFMDEPKSFRPSIAPATASGTVVMIMNGCLKLSNCAASTR
jgi:hypothetical protein